MRRFNPSSPHGLRATQAWTILVGKAMNRQTVTYSGLAELMYNRKAAGVLAQILGKIASFCDDNGLPHLNAIVVGAKRGTPGEGLPGDHPSIDAVREKVFACDWYDIVPPTIDEMNQAGWGSEE